MTLTNIIHGTIFYEFTKNHIANLTIDFTNKSDLSHYPYPNPFPHPPMFLLSANKHPRTL